MNMDNLKEFLQLFKHQGEHQADNTRFYDKETRAWWRGRASMAEALMLMLEKGTSLEEARERQW